MKSLILVRGIPGSGKTTFAEFITPPDVPVISADNYFYENGKFSFQPDKLGEAHKYSQLCALTMMEKGFLSICVANTFTTQKEMEPYFEMADKYGYRVFSIIVENRHGNNSVHNVPDKTILAMKERFNTSL